MRECVASYARAVLDLRVIVGICGVLLSIVMHELFHIILHLGEIKSIHLFPDAHAIVEVLIKPAAEHNLVIEEAIAYTITMITLLLTAMLVADIHDARSDSSVEQAIFPKDLRDVPFADTQQARERLSVLLGIHSS